MRTAVRQKFLQHAELKQLLVSTHPHPLLSLQQESYFWGFDSRRGGENMLAKLLMELRSEIVKS